MPEEPAPGMPGLLARGRRLVDRFLPRGALTLSILSFGYFGIGLIRNRVFANMFGASAELDAYNAAFRIPEIAIDILVASGLSAPFVPIFARLREGEDGTRRAETFGRTVLTVAVLVMAISLGFLFLAGPWLADTVWRDFDPATRALYVDLFRINCLAQVLFAASITLGEILVANRRFLFYALAPILYTGGIVVGAVLLGPTMGIHGAALGALGGAAAHLAIRAIGVARTGFRIRAALAVRTSEFREFVRLMLPRMLSYPIDPIVVFLMTRLATAEGPGNASALSFVLDYQFVPVQVIAIAFSLAAFPTLSTLYAERDGPGFRRVLARNIWTIGALTALAAVVIALGSHLLIRVFLGGGQFDTHDVELTASLLAAFAVSIPIDSLSYPLSRGLYATHNTLYQVAGSVVGLIVLVVASQLLAPSLGVFAIPVSYAAGGLAKLVVLVIALVPRARRIGTPDDAAAATSEPAV